MKLTREAKLGLAVAAGFISLSTYVMAQGHSGGGTGGPNGFGPMNNPGLSHMSSQGLTNSEFGRTTAEDARTKFSSPTTSPTTEETTTTTKKGKKKITTKGKSNSSHRVNPVQSASPSTR
ncbi:MAG TPA: hypothetical protein DHU55_07295 [Blastocatellia bacterium]|jgi:hypothetical protein|nr:hypothetical protein [Spartobacteria bacterium]HCX29564.1 hypothetical protein [Blastocatellia bacterium]